MLIVGINIDLEYAKNYLIHLIILSKYIEIVS